jgi:DNA (cytosine-5)-methyltransferase 1
VRYLSVCSGIEAATVAWHGLGWTPVAFSEIEPFPSAVLAHHYPDVPNVGDMTKFKEWNLEPIDLLVGGTPCQSFSVAGLRKGLDDPRGNLMLTFLAIAERHRPQWIVWENVPGVLSSNGGRDFGTFLGALGELGYGWAYRVLDAQWFGVAQRRRRVFVVGCLGDQASAAAVCAFGESVQRNPAPSREKRKDTTGSTGDGVARCVTAGEMKRQDWETCNMVAQPVAFRETADCLTSAYGTKWNGNASADNGSLFAAQPVAICTDMRGHGDGHTAPTLRAKETANDFAPMVAVAQPVAFAQNTRDEVRLMNGDGSIVGALAAEPGMKQTCYVAQPVATFAKTHKPMSATDAEGWSPVDAAPTVTHWPRDRSDAGTDVAVVQPVGSFKPGQSAAARSIGYEAEVAPALEGGGGGNNKPAVHVAMQVRRLTPVECERLQGFPDGYTNIPWRKKPEAPDGPRYKALGNSMAVPCMKWIGERIAGVTK